MGAFARLSCLSRVCGAELCENVVVKETSLVFGAEQVQCAQVEERLAVAQ